MKNNRLKYILVLSLLLNFSFLCAAGYTYYQKSRYRTCFSGYGIPGRIPMGSSSTQPYLFEALSLKPEQRKLFDQKASLFHKALNKKREKVDQLRRSLFELMSDDYPDSKAIEAIVVEISRVQEDTQKLVVSHMLDFKSMLDKDQQKKFFDLIQETMMMRQEIHYP